MKIVRTFVSTLIVVIAVGGVFLYKEDIIKGAKSVLATKASGDNPEEVAENITKVEDTDTNEASSKSLSVTEEIKKKVVSEIAEAVVKETVKNYGGDTADDIKKVIDSVEEKDKEKVTEILTDNLSLDSIGDVQSYIAENDVDGLMEYAQDKLTAQEFSELTGIFEKYSENVVDQLEKAAD